MRKLSAVLPFLLIVLRLQAQWNSAIVEDSSYAMYLRQDWHALVRFAAEAREQGIDYYLLRMREGIALYESKQYRAALPQFRKALEFDSQSQAAREYEALCLLKAERYEELIRILPDISAESRERLSLKEKPGLAYLYFEAGQKSPDRKDKFQNAGYFQAGLTHNLQSGTSVLHAFTWFGQRESRFDYNQLQYYLRLNIPRKDDWLISPAFHFSTLNTTGGLNGSSTFGLLASLQIRKSSPYTEFSASTGFSTYYNSIQFFPSAGLAVFPFANQKWVPGCNVTLLAQSDTAKTFIAFQPYLSWRPVNAFRLTASALFNQARNLSEDNGYFINNSPDPTRLRLSLLGSIRLSSRLSVYGIGAWEKKQQRQEGYEYHYLSLFAGIKITP